MSESFGDRVPAWRRGLLNGLIDMVFELDGRYWFLDWKTTTPVSARGGVPVGAWEEDSLRDTMSRGIQKIDGKTLKKTKKCYILSQIDFLRVNFNNCFIGGVNEL